MNGFPFTFTLADDAVAILQGPQTPAATSLSQSASGKRPLYRKEAIRVGTYYANNPAGPGKIPLHVPQSRIDHWASTFQKMIEDGEQIDLSVDHIQGVRGVIGKVLGTEIGGKSLFFHTEPADADAETIMLRAQQVSVEIEPKVVTGSGKVYHDAITKVSVVTKPVIPDQLPFERIAASRDHTQERAVVWLLGYTGDDPSTNEPNDRSDSMLTQEQKAEAIKKLSLSSDATDEQIGQKLMLSLDEKRADPKATETLKAKDDRIAELETENTELKASKPVKLSQDILGQLEEGIEAKLETMVEKHKLTPAAAEKIGAVLKGGGAVLLSREHASGDTSFARQLLDALNENDPVKLSQLSGEATGVQVLSREDTKPEERDKQTQSRADRVWGDKDTK